MLVNAKLTVNLTDEDKASRNNDLNQTESSKFTNFTDFVTQDLKNLRGVDASSILEDNEKLSKLYSSLNEPKIDDCDNSNLTTCQRHFLWEKGYQYLKIQRHCDTLDVLFDIANARCEGWDNAFCLKTTEDLKCKTWIPEEEWWINFPSFSNFCVCITSPFGFLLSHPFLFISYFLIATGIVLSILSLISYLLDWYCKNSDSKLSKRKDECNYSKCPQQQNDCNDDSFRCSFKEKNCTNDSNKNQVQNMASKALNHLCESTPVDHPRRRGRPKKY